MNVQDETSKIATKAIRQVEKYEKESRYLVKRSEDFQVIEEVFDKPTRMTLYALMNAKVVSYLNGIVKAGKESRVYWGVAPNGQDVAVKIYLTTSSDFKKRAIYLTGDPRFKSIGSWSHRLVEIWAQKEFKNLQTAYQSRVNVPRPIAVKRNVLAMEFFGQNGQPLPLLAESTPTQSDYRMIISMVKKLYRKAELVHADLSEFNIMKGNGKLVMFDMGSSVDLRHRMAQQFLIRDLTHINHFFSKNKIEVVPLEELVRELVGVELSSIDKSIF